MDPLLKNPLLDSYWLSFPDDDALPSGVGVTAFSLEDAHALLDDFGIVSHRHAKRIDVLQGVTLSKLPSWVPSNSGPLIFRGLWYPCYNLGQGEQSLRELRRARLEVVAEAQIEKVAEPAESVPAEPQAA